MIIRNITSIEPIDDTCGRIQQLYDSENITIAYVMITGKARSHLHKKTEEVYYVQKGRGNLFIGDDKFKVEPGDIVPLPKNTFHHLERISAEPLELLVVTNPRYDVSDVIEPI